MAKTDFQNQLDEADEFVEVKGNGGDFAPVHNFAENDTLVGVYLSTEQKLIKGEDRILHNFEVDGEPRQAWGAAILDSRLSEVEPGSRVKIVRPAQKVATSNGRKAWDYKVYVARSAFKG